MQQGFGMTNMRKRAQAIGGEWRIESTLERGTQVSVRIPRRATV
jgi:signal transduction histidine kinase